MMNNLRVSVDRERDFERVWGQEVEWWYAEPSASPSPHQPLYKYQQLLKFGISSTKKNYIIAKARGIGVTSFMVDYAKQFAEAGGRVIMGFKSMSEASSVEAQCHGSPGRRDIHVCGASGFLVKLRQAGVSNTPAPVLIYADEMAVWEPRSVSGFMIFQTLCDLVRAAEYPGKVQVVVASTPQPGSDFNTICKDIYLRANSGIWELKEFSWKCVPHRDEAWREQMISFMGREQFEVMHECRL